MQYIYNLILLRLIEPIRYKIKFYNVAILLYIDRVLCLLNTKYDFLRKKINEQKAKLKILQLEQLQIKLEYYESFKDFKLFGKLSIFIIFTF